MVPNVKRRSAPEQIERFYQLVQSVTTSSADARYRIDTVYRRTAKRVDPDGVELLSLVTELQRELFPDTDTFAPVGNSDEITPVPSDLTLTETDTTGAEIVRISVPNLSDSYRRREALTVLKLRIGIHFHALSIRDRLILWTELQDDLSALHGPGQAVLDKIHKNLLSELTEIEQKALTTELDANLVCEALNDYWNYTYDPLPPTMRSALESQYFRLGSPGSTHPIPRSARLSQVKSSRKFSFRRSLLLGLAITFAAVGAQQLYEIGKPKPPSRDIITLSVLSASAFQPDFRTTNCEQAEKYIFDRLGLRLQIPLIKDAGLLGVGIQLFHGDMEVPVLLYRDQREALEFPVFVYSYNFLQTNRRRVELARDLLLRIEDPTQFGVKFYSGGSTLVWRNRDDIFAAVLRVDPGEMQQRIRVC